MSDIPSTTFVMLGLVGSGKTNFLVGLDVVLDDQTDSSRLIHDGLAAERAYLQPLKEQWLEGKKLERTSQQRIPAPHQLLVRHAQTGVKASVYLPDMPGETFDTQFEGRSFSSDFFSRIKSAGGLLLFVSSTHASDHEILEESQLMESSPPPEHSNGSTLSQKSSNPAPVTSSATDWTIDKAARQIKLVDLLQFVSEIRTRSCPLKVAVVISAWDRVEAIPSQTIPKDPLQFLIRCWPLLHQYLNANSEVFHFTVYGISARGGGDTSEEALRLTAQFERPIERILVVDGNSRSNDLTRPIRWLMGV